MLRMTASVMTIILMRVTADSFEVERLPLVRGMHFIGAFGGVSTFACDGDSGRSTDCFKKTVRRRVRAGSAVGSSNFELPVDTLSLERIEVVKDLAPEIGRGVRFSHTIRYF
jgi:hypothetical protein